MPDESSGTLWIVATPIGNVEDLSPRAERTLREVDYIACEDTRHTGVLLKRLEIKSRYISLHAHNEASRTDQIIEHLREGSDIALVTDAGYPGVSDPGQRLIHAVIATEIPHSVIPGPSAPLMAIAGAGIPWGAFTFGGFLSTKKGRRRNELTEAIERAHPTVFFESPHRLCGTLEILTELAPDQILTVARELTKKFEEFKRGTATELSNHYTTKPPKGEITLVIAGTELPKWFSANSGEEKEISPQN